MTRVQESGERSLSGPSQWSSSCLAADRIRDSVLFGVLKVEVLELASTNKVLYDGRVMHEVGGAARK